MEVELGGCILTRLATFFCGQTYGSAVMAAAARLITTIQSISCGFPNRWQEFIFCIFFLSLVASGFPAGQTALKTRLEEIRIAVEDGAREIDIVINRTLALSGQWEGEHKATS